MAVFRVFRCFNPEKAHPCAEPRCLTYTRENRFRSLGCGCRALEEPKKPSKHIWCIYLRIRGKETHLGIITITIKGLGMARGRISRFPIDLRRRPYNTLALPCECVKSKFCKFKMTDGRHTENCFLAISRCHSGQLMRNLDRKWRITCRYRSRN